MKFPNWLKVHGDQSFRGKCPVETLEQVTFLNQLPPEWRAIVIHPRNEGKRTFEQARRHKAEGMTAGAADIIIPGNPTLVIEFKRQNHVLSEWEDGQQEYLKGCMDKGATVCVALGWKAAMAAFEEWLQHNYEA